MKNTTKNLLIGLGVFVVLLVLVTPTLHKKIRAQQEELVYYLPTNDRIKEVPDQNLEKLIKDSIATTVIFVDPRNEKLNKDFFKFVKEDSSNKLNRTVYIYEEIYPTSYMKNLDLDLDNKIQVVFFEDQKKSNSFTVDSKFNLEKDFDEKVNKISMGR